MSEQVTGAGPRTAVVTGSASGIGAATVTALRRAGWRVTGWDLDGADCPPVDVSDYESVATAAAGLGRVDLLVNCAGIGGGGPAAQLSPQVWDHVLKVDLSGVFYCCRALHPALAATGGLIVNIASITAHRAGRGRAAYCTAKAGVVMLTEVLGIEWAADGIRVIGVSPTYVRTPMVERALAAGSLDADAIEARTPLGRMAEPDEVADFILALTGPGFGLVTASTLRLDGGWTANGDY